MNSQKPFTNAQTLIKMTPLQQDLFLPENGWYDDIYKVIEKAGFDPSGKMVKKCEEVVRKCHQTTLSHGEALAVCAYTWEADNSSKSPYKIVNEALASRRHERIKKLSNYILFLLSGLRNLGKTSCSRTLYRGIDGCKVNWETHKEGNILSWPAFTSTTTSSETAFDFYTNDNIKDPTMFEIHGEYIGYDIKELSCLPSEDGK